MKILVVCDAPFLQTGFARVGANLVDRWIQRGAEVEVWGINTSSQRILTEAYTRQLPCRIWPAGQPWQSAANLQRLLDHIAVGGYTHLWVMQDHFLLAAANFPEMLRATCEKAGVRSIYYVPIDGTIDMAWTPAFEAFDRVVAYTPYGRTELERVLGKVRYPDIECIPHGVGPEYRPLPPEERAKARAELMPWVAPDDIVLLNVNAHQKRKDLSRSLEILAELRRKGHRNAKLLLHTPSMSPTEHTSLRAVAEQLGLKRGAHWNDASEAFAPTGHAKLPESELVRLYNAADLLLTTTLGEGWGLSLTEALACGTPIAAPDHTACADILQDTGNSATFSDMAIPLWCEVGGLVLPWDNSRVRKRVDLEEAAGRIGRWMTETGGKVERKPLDAALRERWDWNRIADRWLHVMQDTRAWKPPLYVEFGGGLGDVFNGMHTQNAGVLIDELKPGERAVVAVISHCPTVAEIWKHHPKRSQIELLALPYWEGEEDAYWRSQHGLPPPGALWRLPDSLTKGLAQWYVSDDEWDLITSVLNPHPPGSIDDHDPIVLVAAGAGLPHRCLPQALIDRVVSAVLDANYRVALIGKRYPRHGREEPLPSQALRARCFDLTDKLSVPAAATLLSQSSGLVTAHSAWNILGWHRRIPQFLAYPPNLPHCGKDEWSFGWDFPETVRCTFDEDPTSAIERFIQLL